MVPLPVGNIVVVVVVIFPNCSLKLVSAFGIFILGLMLVEKSEFLFEKNHDALNIKAKFEGHKWCIVIMKVKGSFQNMVSLAHGGHSIVVVVVVLPNC